MKRFMIVAACAAVVGLIGCNTTTAPVETNYAPVITASTPDSLQNIERSAVLTFSVTATDVDGDALTYLWATNGGTLAANGSSAMTWTSPDSVKYKMVQVSISDGKGHTVTKGWNVGVGILLVPTTIATPTIWKTGNIYLVNSYCDVTSTLTIQPGVIAKFGPSATLSASASGTITGGGTLASHIVFTSIKDDAFGGDINGDGTTSTAARSDWGGVSTNGGNQSNFTYCDFYYATTALYLNSSSSGDVTSCTFAHNATGLNVSAAGYGATCTKNVMYDNTHPMLTNLALDVDSSNIFHNPAAPTQMNTFQQIDISTGTAEHAVRWDSTGVSIVISQWVSINSTLTIKPGVIVKFGPAATLTATANGTITAEGSPNGSTDKFSIIFTSIKDDAHGGDNNGDGTTSTPDKSDWGLISTDGGNGSSFINCQIYYSDGGLKINGGRANIQYCIFAHNKIGIDLSGAGLNTMCNGNAMFNNEKPMYANANVDLYSNMFQNPNDARQKNTFQGVLVSGSASITTSISWGLTEVAIVMENWLTISSTLRLGPGTVLKFKAGQQATVDVNGSIDLSGAFLTSYKDDSKGGDSNGDGSATSPGAGDWIGLYYDATQAYDTSSSISYAAH